MFETVGDFPFYVITLGDQIVGFGMIRPHNKLNAFKETCEITYFIDHRYTQKGLGRKLIEMLEKDARKMGIR